MLALFSSVQSLLKQDKVHISNKVFLMHSKVTVIILSVFSILVSSRQFFGNPIDCTVHGAPAYMMETFCWIHATYTVPELMAKVIGKDASHVGISTHVEGEDEVKFHKYYQWVCFVLFFQGLLEFSFKKFFNFFDNKQKIIFKHFYHAAICFFLPRCLWKSLEGCRMKALVLSCGKELDKENKKENLFKYFEDNLKRHNVYFLRFVICEVLNFVNVIVQIKFLDFFLDGEFSTYGTEVLKFLETDTELRVDPMSRVFPTMTKCVFYQYGPSGGIKSYDGKLWDLFKIHTNLEKKFSVIFNLNFKFFLQACAFFH